MYRLSPTPQIAWEAPSWHPVYTTASWTLPYSLIPGAPLQVVHHWDGPNIWSSRKQLYTFILPHKQTQPRPFENPGNALHISASLVSWRWCPHRVNINHSPRQPFKTHLHRFTADAWEVRVTGNFRNLRSQHERSSALRLMGVIALWQWGNHAPVLSDTPVTTYNIVVDAVQSCRCLQNAMSARTACWPFWVWCEAEQRIIHSTQQPATGSFAHLHLSSQSSFRWFWWSDSKICLTEALEALGAPFS